MLSASSADLRGRIQVGTTGKIDKTSTSTKSGLMRRPLDLTLRVRKRYAWICFEAERVRVYQLRVVVSFMSRNAGTIFIFSSRSGTGVLH